jgi:hypothetical protein
MVKLIKKHFGLFAGSILVKRESWQSTPIKSSASYYEEIEGLRPRGCSFRLAGVGHVRRVTSFEVGEPLDLEVDQTKCCDAE